MVEFLGSNFRWVEEQKVQFDWGRRRALEPVSMRTELWVWSLLVLWNLVWWCRVLTYKFCGGVPTDIVVYHWRSVWSFLIQSVKGAEMTVLLSEVW